jgi:hypothetical protein
VLRARSSGMGTLYYGAARTPARIDDRILAHTKLVSTSKQRGIRIGEATLR